MSGESTDPRVAKQERARADAPGDASRGGSMSVLKAAGLGIAMILGICLSIVCGVFLFIEPSTGGPQPPTWFLVGGIAVGILLVPPCIRGMVRLNDRSKAAFRASFEREEDELLAHWHVPPDVWQDFATREFERAATGRVVVSLAVGGSFALVSAVSTSPVLTMTTAASVIAGVFVVMTLAAYFGTKYVKEAEYRWRRRQRDVAIWLRPDGMRVNQKIRVWNRMNSRLLEASLKEPREGTDYNIFQARVRIASGNHKSNQTYRAPVPPHAYSQVARAVESMANA